MELPLLAAGKKCKTNLSLTVSSPEDGRKVGETFFADEALLEETLARLHKERLSFQSASADQRAAWCEKTAELLEKNRPAFAKTISEEAGKPIQDADREVSRAVLTFRDAACVARTLLWEALPLDVFPGVEKRFGIVRRFPPAGVLAITPFNFPLNLVAHKAAPCLACGAPFLLKPSPRTPLTALKLGELFLEAGVPPSAFAVLCLSNENTLKAVRDERLPVVSFTGSAAVGWRLKAEAPRKKFLLELGGTAGAVLENPPRRAFAVTRCVAGSFGYAGQTCISVQKILVHQKHVEWFKKDFLEATAKLRVGPLSDPQTAFGPMIDEAAAARVESWIQEARKEGARILLGGKRKGNFLEPTILENVPKNCRISCEEVFGPVVVLESYENFSRALEKLNASPYGLQAGVFTDSLAQVHEAFHKLEVGAVIVNDVPTFRVDTMPYGGVKESGLGREGVRFAVEEITERRLLAIFPDAPLEPS